VSVPGTLYVQDEAPAVPVFPQRPAAVAPPPGVAAADAAPEAMKSVPPIRPIAPAARSIRLGFTLSSFPDALLISQNPGMRESRGIQRILRSDQVTPSIHAGQSR
jgi:hypothetical protein